MIQEAARAVISLPDSVPGTVVAPDSVAADSVAAACEPRFGILLTAPEQVRPVMRGDQSTGMSLVLSLLAVVFCVVGLRFRNNRKYVTALWHNLTEVRMRTNAFDDTVRETSFLVLLNVMWSCAAGIVLWGALTRYGGEKAAEVHPAMSICVCMAVAAVYTGAMTGTYFMTGWVFGTAQKARIWVKGFAASQGLAGFVLLPLSLVLVFYGSYVSELLWIGAGIFLIGKIMFIWKGFRIFFVQNSSWMLFLYYLCGLEIVPLILSYTAAMGFCRLL